MPPEFYGWKYASVVCVVVALLIAALFWRRRLRITCRSTLVANSILSTALFALVLLLFEGLFFLFYDQTDSFMLTNVSKRWFVRHVHLNNAGCRDFQDFESVRPSGVFRIILLGDSFTFGYGIRNGERRFGDQLQNRLNDLSPGRFQIYNMAACGAETADHLRLIRTIGRSNFEFDMILLIYTLNDASQLLPETNKIYSRIDRLKPTFWPLRDMYLFNFLYYRAVLLSVSETADYYSWVARAYRDPIWSRHRTELEQVANAGNDKLRVVTFPLVANVGVDYPFQVAHEQLSRVWDELEVPQLDLLRFFQGESSHTLVVNRFDGHPNVRSHRIAAEAIFEHFLAEDPAIEAAHRRDFR